MKIRSEILLNKLESYLLLVTLTTHNWNQSRPPHKDDHATNKEDHVQEHASSMQVCKEQHANGSPWVHASTSKEDPQYK